MKKLIAIILLSLIPLPAIAETYVSINGDKKVAVTGLQPNVSYRLISGSMKKFKKKANECGQLSMPWDTDFIVNGVTYDVNTMEVKDPPKCVRGQLSYQTNQPIYKGAGENIVIPGFTPYQEYQIQSGVFRSTKLSKANACGFATFTEKPELQLTGFMSLWSADYTDYKPNILSAPINGDLPICRKGVLYSPR
jgi:hypothetical protein